MPAEIPQGDLSRATTHEPDMSYPDSVEIRLVWFDDKADAVRIQKITADEFFGRGSYGAPIPAEAIVQHIERMRREGPPKRKSVKGTT